MRRPHFSLGNIAQDASLNLSLEVQTTPPAQSPVETLFLCNARTCLSTISPCTKFLSERIFGGTTYVPTIPAYSHIETQLLLGNDLYAPPAFFVNNIPLHAKLLEMPHWRHNHYHPHNHPSKRHFVLGNDTLCTARAFLSTLVPPCTKYLPERPFGGTTNSAGICTH